MTYTVRVSLEGYNALTDTDPDHFALYADQDNVLIKEFSRGAVTVSGSGAGTYEVTHSLGYIPMFLAFVYDPTGYVGPANTWQQIGNANFSIAFWAFATTTKLTLVNASGVDQSYVYYLFYDQQG